jgi:hypothetical protein
VINQFVVQGPLLGGKPTGPRGSPDRRDFGPQGVNGDGAQPGRGFLGRVRGVGEFTIRIGIAAIEVLRPLPYIEARQPRLRKFVSEFLKVGQKPDTNSGRERG